MPTAPYPSDVPFLHIRGEEVAGTPSCALGHTMPRGGGKPDGIYARWHWDGTQLTVENDRYGYYPLFYFTRPGEVCISPSLVHLLDRGAPRELDYPALAVFLRIGYYLAEDTPFRAIRAVPPDVTFRWTKGAFEIAGRLPAIAPIDMPREKAIRTYQELFIEAMRRRPPEGRVVVPLSGGRDSRHIVYELVRSGHKPDAVATVDRRYNTDLEVATTIARTLGLEHLAVAATPPSVANERALNRETHFCSDEHGWITDLRDRLTGRADCLYDGIAGDILSAATFLDEDGLRLVRAGRLEDLARRIIDKDHAEPFLTGLLPPDRLAAVSLDRAVDRLTAELRRYVNAANPVGIFYIYNRTRREIALSSYSLFRHFKTYSPYLDHDVYDFLAALPAEQLVDHLFHDDTTAAGYPPWAHIPYSVRKPAAPVELHNATCALGILSAVLGRRSAWINRRYLAPRLLRAAADPFYARRTIGDLLSRPVYLMQLEEACAQE